eukprot:5117096-Lingulodinium_polyedra.AAC.1
MPASPPAKRRCTRVLRGNRRPTGRPRAGDRAQIVERGRRRDPSPTRTEPTPQLANCMLLE